MRRSLLLALLALALPAAARAQVMQGMGIGHGLGLRPFHERVAQAERAAVVRVERVDEGRIALVREAEIAGAVPERFEVKRSPLAPPPLATGDRALLLLRGDLPPFVIADQPAEVIRLGDDAAMTARWSAAVRSVFTHRGDAAALVPVYVDWIAGGPETLREIGRASLLDLAGKHPELRERIGRAEMENAAHPAR